MTFYGIYKLYVSPVPFLQNIINRGSFWRVKLEWLACFHKSIRWQHYKRDRISCPHEWHPYKSTTMWQKNSSTTQVESIYSLSQQIKASEKETKMTPAQVINPNDSFKSCICICSPSCLFFRKFSLSIYICLANERDIYIHYFFQEVYISIHMSFPFIQWWLLCISGSLRHGSN